MFRICFASHHSSKVILGRCRLGTTTGLPSPARASLTPLFLSTSNLKSLTSPVPEPDKQLFPLLWALQFNSIFYDHSAEFITHKKTVLANPLPKMIIPGWSFLGGSLGTETPRCVFPFAQHPGRFCLPQLSSCSSTDRIRNAAERPCFPARRIRAVPHTGSRANPRPHRAWVSGAS